MLKYAADNMRNKDIARLICIDEPTLYKWFDKDPELKSEFYRNKTLRKATQVQTLIQIANGSRTIRGTKADGSKFVTIETVSTADSMKALGMLHDPRYTFVDIEPEDYANSPDSVSNIANIANKMATFEKKMSKAVSDMATEEEA